MQLTQQIKINPTLAQQVVLEALSEKCRLIYNFALEERITAFKGGIKGINYYKQQNDLPRIKKQYPEYRRVYSKVLQHALRILDANYKSFFSLRKNGHKEARLPKFRGKKYFTTMIHNQSGFKIGQGFAELSHKHPTKTRLRFEIPKKFAFNKVYQVSIYKKDDAEFYLSITYEKQEKEYEDNGLYQAFDLGATKHTAVNTKGKFVEFMNARPDKYWKKPITELQSRRDHCKAGSQKRKKLHKLFSKCRRKCANQLKDFQHKLSHKIVHNTRANTIIVGDLSVKQLCQINEYEHGLHTSLHNTGSIGRFVGFLTYKARLVGKRIIEINERGTSKACCACGEKHEMPLSMRVMSCDCGNVIDRDCNSSVNILLRFLSRNGLWTAYERTVRNLRKTGIPISVLYSKEAPSAMAGKFTRCSQTLLRM